MDKMDIYINLTEKDIFINEWLSCAREWERNVTALCIEAIDYYASTGRILKLGGVTGKWKPEKRRLHLYVSSKTEAYRYLSEQMEKGKKMAGTVRSILLAGIELSENCWIISEGDVLLQKSGQYIEADRENRHRFIKVSEETEEIPSVKVTEEKKKNEGKGENADDIFSILNVPDFG